MKSSEWKRRHKLDSSGIKLLGAACALNTLGHQAISHAPASEHSQKNSPKEPRTGVAETDDTDNNRPDQNARSETIIQMLERLGASESTFDNARQLRIMDFQFRWEHFRDHPILVGYVTDDVPDFATNWPRHVPISELPMPNSVLEAVNCVFESEFRRLTGPDPVRVPELRDDADFLFYLSIWKLCEEEPDKGHPKGSRHLDGTDNAASYAFSLMSRARQQGSPITKSEAIRRALEEFEIVSSIEFQDHPDKEGVIVTNSGNRSDGRKGANKKICETHEGNRNSRKRVA